MLEGIKARKGEEMGDAGRSSLEVSLRHTSATPLSLLSLPLTVSGLALAASLSTWQGKFF